MTSRAAFAVAILSLLSCGEAPPGAAFQGVGFVTPSLGWVASFLTLYATSDGGASWSSLRFGTRINRMRVLNEGLVYACGDRVYRWAR
jgi:hypothetical protein